MFEQNNSIIKCGVYDRNSTYFKPGIQRVDIDKDLTADMKMTGPETTSWQDWNADQSKQYKYLIFARDENWLKSEPAEVEYLPEEE